MTAREDVAVAVALVRTAPPGHRLAAVRFATAVILGRVLGLDPDVADVADVKEPS